MNSRNNPFEFGTIVDGTYFTDRCEELNRVKEVLNSENHLILISPRRYGKSSLVAKALTEMQREHITLNMQSITSVENLAVRLLEAFFKNHSWQRIRHHLASFRITPSITTNPLSEAVTVSFGVSADKSEVALEDALTLIDNVAEPDNKIIIVLDEFQEITTLSKGLDKRLRAIMQAQHNINYVLLGSQESMMTQIFEQKKSPFYHFGQLMRLNKIPYNEFHSYLSERLNDQLASEILNFTNCHPYYTQQLAFQVWNLVHYEHIETSVTERAVNRLVTMHDLDFERIWVNFNQSDRRILQSLSRSESQSLSSDRTTPTSTTYSAAKRLMTQGYIVRTENYEIEDPFFRNWIIKQNS